MKTKIAIGFLFLTTLLCVGYNTTGNVLNCSQWTRVMGTNGFQTTLTGHLTNPIYALKSTLHPPPPIGRELVAYVMLKYKTSALNIKYDAGVTKISCPQTDSPGCWAPASPIYINTNYISSLVSDRFNMPTDTDPQECYGFTLTPEATREWRKFIVVVQSYTKWNQGTLAIPLRYYGEITSPMDEQAPVMKPEDTGLPLRFTFGTETASLDHMLSAVYVFYEEL